MSYTSYNEYIVENNGAVLLGLVIINYLTFTFNIWPLNYLLSTYVFLLLESMLSLACTYKIWGVSKVYILPYINKVKFPYGRYLFAPGPATKSIWNFLRSGFSKLFGKKPIEDLNMTPITAPTPVPVKKRFMLNFLTNANESNGTPIYTNSLATTPIRTNIDPSFLANIIDRKSAKEVQRSKALKDVLAKHSALVKSSTYNKFEKSSRNAVPQLEFNSCLKPPLEPSAYRERSLWYLNPTPEIVDDFRIVQILTFRKYWNKFNDRLSGLYYDKMTDILHKKIFEPLAKSIIHFNTLLTRSNQTIVKCSPDTIAHLFIIPGFNKDSAFTIFEVVDFITLNGYFSEEVKQYVVDRIIEFSHGNKFAAYKFTPSLNPGKPTDSQIIMHVFTTYLSIKEPHAIPPLIPADVDLFKFLLIYIYMTPELDHWKIFE